MEQIRQFDTEQIIRIWMRLNKFENSDKEKIRNKTAYLIFILDKYGVSAKQKKKIASSISSAPLFEKEEKDTVAGISYWNECLKHIDCLLYTSPSPRDRG